MEDEDDFVEIRYPPRLPLSPVHRNENHSFHQKISLCHNTYTKFVDSSGRLVDEHGLRKAVFQGKILNILTLLF